MRTLAAVAAVAAVGGGAAVAAALGGGGGDEAPPARTARASAGPPVLACRDGDAPATAKPTATDVVVGPLTLLGAAEAASEPAFAFRARDGMPFVWKMPVAVRAGAAATVALAPSSRGRASLTYGLDPRLPSVAAGRSAVGFEACAPGQSPGSGAPAAPLTSWPGGVAVTRPQCVALDVAVRGDDRPRRLNLGFGVRRCPPR